MESEDLDNGICYNALLARDPRFDGVIFVGVASTGIYCRPVCPARTPKPENCTFYRSAAAAERAGHRPCLRCRPELAPGNARIDAVGRLAAAAANAIEDGELSEMTVDAMAARLGVTDRHLRRAVEREYGVSPIGLAQTQRLLAAKRLLTDTLLPVTEIAFASGFASLRRFNALFRERYRMKPTDLRRAAKGVPGSTLVCEVAFRPPFDWESHLDFIGRRAIAGVETVADSRYGRTVAIGSTRGWIAVGLSQRPNTLRVEMSESLAPKMIAVVAGVKRVFDVAANPAQIAARLGPLAEARPGLRVPGAFDGFEVGVRAILGQQVTVRAATTLAGRFAAALGEPLETPIAGLTHTMANPQAVAGAKIEDLTALGILASRARTIIDIAAAVGSDELRLNSRADPLDTMAAMKRIRGVGEWTAQYVAMRALGWPDAFPHADLGILKALGTKDPRVALARAEEWRPWRAYAAMHLWKSLEEPS
jgi:AraC family transcriptional regulator of adaptative response / DNA-3-methyladenine glycosylase II